LPDNQPPRLRPSSYANYTIYTRTHVVPRLGDIELQRLSPSNLSAFFPALLTDAPVTELEADEVGASLKWATAKVERASQRGNGERSSGRERQAEPGAGDDSSPYFCDSPNEPAGPGQTAADWG
jgi:hypothetical protein